jgi:hypothetical protein
MVFHVPESEAVFGDPDFKTEIYAFPGKHAGKVEPVRISDGAYDDRFVLTWTHAWSPDGAVFAFDAATAHFNAEPESDSRVFVSEFGAGMPGSARRVEGLPEGALLAVDAWDPTSSGFTVMAWEPTAFNSSTATAEAYLVRREGSELTASLVALRSEQVDWARPCAGANHVLYATEEGDVVLRPVTGAEATFRWTEESGLADAYASHDAEWVVVSSIEDGRSKLTLFPCGEGAGTVLLEDLEQPAWASLSPKSRYLALFAGDGPPSYLELPELGTPRPFAEGVTDLYGWGLDESFALVGNEEDDLLLYSPETGETELVRAGTTDFEQSGDLLLFYETNDAGDDTGFEIIHPRDPDKVLGRASASEGSALGSVLVDDAGTQLAFSEIYDGGARVVVLDLATGGEKARFEFRGALVFHLESFAADGSGVLVSVDRGEVSLYFLPLEGEQKDAILISRASFGDVLGARPRP